MYDTNFIPAILDVSNEQTHKLFTVCPGSSDPFYILTYYIKWVTTSWTHSIPFSPFN